MATTVIIAATTAGGSNTASPAEGTTLRVVAYGLDEPGEKCNVYVVTPLGDVPAIGRLSNGQSGDTTLTSTNPIIQLAGGWDYKFVLSKTNSQAAVYKMN